MMHTLDKPLSERIILESQRRCAELTEMALRYSPDIRTSFHPTHFPNELQVAFGFIHDPAGDELAFEIGLTSRDGRFWCEVTMFVGQATRAAIGNSWWDGEYPTEGEVAALIADAFSLLAPRAERALQQLTQPPSPKSR
jgi:hypothetical protein